MSQQCVVFAPQNKLQVRALIKYIEKNEAVIAVRKQNRDYLSAVANVREILAQHFAVYPPQKRVTVCPWDITGAKSMCMRIAETYSVPYWDVVGAANPYAAQ